MQKESQYPHFFSQQHVLKLQKVTARWQSMIFSFHRPAKTSRNTLFSRESFFLLLSDDAGRVGIGEAAPISGLSREWTLLNDSKERRKLCQKMEDIVQKINNTPQNGHSIEQSLIKIHTSLTEFPSLTMALEMAWLDLCGGGEKILFSSPFCRGEKSITINGLVWMADPQNILLQIKNLLTRGFNCIKMKIDLDNLAEIIKIISKIRKEHQNITIRLDANGCFKDAEIALKSIKKLYPFDIHSIEQPLPARFEENIEESAKEWNYLIKESPIKLAFDEELIKIEAKNRKKLLEKIQIPFLVLKPSLLGGFTACEEWIQLATKFSRKWWITSALESNIGLNAIAQWTYSIIDKKKEHLTPQGLGTGELFSNNFPSPIQIKKNKLFHTKKNWDLAAILTQKKQERRIKK